MPALRFKIWQSNHIQEDISSKTLIYKDYFKYRSTSTSCIVTGEPHPNTLCLERVANDVGSHHLMEKVIIQNPKTNLYYGQQVMWFLIQNSTNFIKCYKKWLKPLAKYLISQCRQHLIYLKCENGWNNTPNTIYG